MHKNGYPPLSAIPNRIRQKYMETRTQNDTKDRNILDSDVLRMQILVGISWKI